MMKHEACLKKVISFSSDNPASFIETKPSVFEQKPHVLPIRCAALMIICTSAYLHISKLAQTGMHITGNDLLVIVFLFLSLFFSFFFDIFLAPLSHTLGNRCALKLQREACEDTESCGC